MVDLVIKPTPGSGNSVILQDQSGAAVLTTADSGATIASGVTFPAGHVIQVQHFVYSTYHNYTTPTTATETPILKAITPDKDNSRMLVFVNVSMVAHDTTTNTGQLALYKDIAAGGFNEMERWDMAVRGQGTARGVGAVGVVFYDTVTSLDELTYKVYVRNNESSGDIRINDYSVSAGAPSSSITLMEISV